jgi:hypothetical protein
MAAGPAAPQLRHQPWASASNSNSNISSLCGWVGCIVKKLCKASLLLEKELDDVEVRAACAALFPDKLNDAEAER